LETDAQPEENENLVSPLEKSNEILPVSAPEEGDIIDAVCQKSEPVTATADTHDSLVEDLKLLDFNGVF